MASKRTTFLPVLQLKKFDPDHARFRSVRDDGHAAGPHRDALPRESL